MACYLSARRKKFVRRRRYSPFHPPRWSSRLDHFSYSPSRTGTTLSEMLPNGAPFSPTRYVPWDGISPTAQKRIASLGFVFNVRYCSALSRVNFDHCVRPTGGEFAMLNRDALMSLDSTIAGSRLPYDQYKSINN